VGEKQRISLARAFLKNAPIIILDEPTSSLDIESQQMVMEGLKELMKERTTLMVAHRRATLTIASKIMVLNQGKIEEFGSPQDLLKSGGYYARLANG
jgi:ABC-type multidrug transport system fused ATPase/permease subunit